MGLLHKSPGASELTANAALHSDSRLPGGTFTLRAEISRGHHARIEIEDNGGPWTSATADSTGQHGLDIVRAPATDWAPTATTQSEPPGHGSTGKAIHSWKAAPSA